jgi:predicted nucleic acid-binding Zn ribbon protein
MMEEIGKSLPAIFKRHLRAGDERMVEILGVLWPRVAGKGIAENSRPIAFVAGTLTLETTCASWAVQLRRMSDEIREGINHYMGLSVVREIQVRLASNLGQRDPELTEFPFPSSGIRKVDAPR